jgi:hypothetical protein
MQRRCDSFRTGQSVNALRRRADEIAPDDLFETRNALQVTEHLRSQTEHDHLHEFIHPNDLPKEYRGRSLVDLFAGFGLSVN